MARQKNWKARLAMERAGFGLAEGISADDLAAYDPVLSQPGGSQAPGATPPGGAASILAGGTASYTTAPYSYTPRGGPLTTAGVTGESVFGYGDDSPSGSLPGGRGGGGLPAGGGRGGVTISTQGKTGDLIAHEQAIINQQLEAKTKLQAEQNKFIAGESSAERENRLKLAQEEFNRRSSFAQPFLQQLAGEGAGDPGAAFSRPGAPSESEQILIQAQREAGERELNQLQDILSSAGTFRSGSLNRYATQILGATRAGVARTTAGFAESRLTRRHQQDLAKRQQLNQLLMSVLA